LPQGAGERLDSYLANVYGTSRNQVAKWIRSGVVLVGARTAKPSLKLEGGEWISCEPLLVSQEGVLEPEHGPLRILHQDDSLIVLDKAADLVVHPGAGRQSGTLAHRLLDRFPEIGEVGGAGRPGIVHRLDKGTSGIMVIARTAEAYQVLSKAFSERHVDKKYLAIVFGAPSPSEGLVDAAIARHPQRRKEMTISDRGRPARTGYRTLASTDEASLLELSLETGRTHQIRVHLKHLGYPIIGDPVYGEARWKSLPKRRQKIYREFPRPALHAWRLAFAHPADGHQVDYIAPPPPDFEHLWQRLSGSDLPIG
jgi:23S rRNA pseudouridine1911/1915/1917 synthase